MEFRVGRITTKNQLGNTARRHCAYGLLAIFLLAHLVACQGEAPDQFFIKKPWDTQLAFIRSPQLAQLTMPRLLWQRSDMALALTDDPSSDHLLSGLIDKPMVMVSFGEGSMLGAELLASPSTLFFKHPTSMEAGLALIPSPDAAELARIASLAHDHRFAMPCGQLETITGLVHQSATTKHYPPVYADHQHLTQVKSLLAQVDAANITATVETLSAIKTRRFDTPTGREVPATLTKLFEQADQGRLTGLTITTSALNSYPNDQQNLVVHLPGTSEPTTTVIIGAHMDTILGAAYTKDGQSPGADDDASGLAVITEVLRILSASGATFARSIEFHAYAAEEVGLIGSKALANSYFTSGRAVAAMLQLDMVLYANDSSDRTIHLVSTDTSAFLRRSLKNLLNNYLGGSYTELALAAGTSDHKSWHSLGYPAVFPFENPQTGGHNQNIHSPSDTLANASNSALAARFAQMTLAFLGHHAGLISAKADYGTQMASAPLPDDLKLAIVPAATTATTTAAQWDIAVAAPASFAKIEVCKVTPKLSDFACQSPLQALDFVHLQHNRNFFINPTSVSYTLADGEALAVFAYASDDTIVARRTVGLSQPAG